MTIIWFSILVSECTERRNKGKHVHYKEAAGNEKKAMQWCLPSKSDIRWGQNVPKIGHSPVFIAEFCKFCTSVWKSASKELNFQSFEFLPRARFQDSIKMQNFNYFDSSSALSTPLPAVRIHYVFKSIASGNEGWEIKEKAEKNWE